MALHRGLEYIIKRLLRSLLGMGFCLCLADVRPAPALNRRAMGFAGFLPQACLCPISRDLHAIQYSQMAGLRIIGLEE